MGNMENSVKPHENKMGTMPMTRLILTMSLPAIFSMTIQAMLINVDDSILSKSATQAQTTDHERAQLWRICKCFLIAFWQYAAAIGVNSFVSRKLGEKNFVHWRQTRRSNSRSCNLYF